MERSLKRRRCRKAYRGMKALLIVGDATDLTGMQEGCKDKTIARDDFEGAFDRRRENAGRGTAGLWARRHR